MKRKSHNTPSAVAGTWFHGEDGKLYFQCEAHRLTEIDILMEYVDDDDRDELCERLKVLREEFTS